MTHRFYILLLFDFVLDFQNKQKNVVNLNDVVLRQYLDKSILHSLKNIILYFFSSSLLFYILAIR